MPLSHFQHGFNHGVSILGMPVLNMYSGNVFWVDSASGDDSTQNSGGVAQPFATIDYAFSRVDQNGTTGDLILAAPNHAETIATAGGVTQDIAGVTVIGLGTGNQVPTLTYSTTGSTWLITANNSHVKNIKFLSNVNSCTAAIVIGTAADADIVRGTTVQDCFFGDNTLTDTHFINCVTALSTAENDNDDLTVKDCFWHSEDDACLALVTGGSDIARLHLTGNYIDHAGTAGGLYDSTTAGDSHQEVWIADNLVSTLSTTSTVNQLVDGGTAADNTGFIVRNAIGHLDTDSALPIDMTGVAIDENYSNSAVDLSGALLLPVADS